MSIQSDKLTEISKLYADFKIQKKQQKFLTQTYESNNIAMSGDIQSFNKVVFKDKETKSRNEAVYQIKDGVENLERLNDDYNSIKKKLFVYSELTKDSDQFDNTQKLCNEEASKLFSYAESVYHFQKDVISCNKFVSKLTESEAKVQTNCQEYMQKYLSDKILDSLQNICRFKFKIKNLLILMRDLCQKNYHVRLEEVKKFQTTNSQNPSTRNTVTNYGNDSFEHEEDAKKDKNHKDNNASNKNDSKNKDKQNVQQDIDNNLNDIDKNKFVQKSSVLNKNSDQHNFDSRSVAKVDKVNSNNLKDQINFNSQNKSDQFSHLGSLSRKDKVSMLMSKISIGKQSIWSIKDYEDMLIPENQIGYANNDNINTNNDLVGVNEKTNKLIMSQDDGPNKNLAYLSPPPPLNQATKTRLEKSEQAMMHFNLDDQANNVSRKTKEVFDKFEEAGSKRNSKRNSQINIKRENKPKVKSRPTDAKVEKEDSRCNPCSIF